MKRYRSIEVAVYDQAAHRHGKTLPDLLCEGATVPYDAEVTKAFNFYGLTADYPLMLDYAVHALDEQEFVSTPKSSPFQIGDLIFWRKDQSMERS